MERGPAGSAFSWTSVVAVLLVGWGIVRQPAPLRSARPAPEAFPQAESRSSERLPARLWEDPLRVAYQHQQRGEQTDLIVTADVLEEECKERKPLILAVMLHGAPYAEDRENRLRSRYAVHAALSTADYRPDQVRTLGAAVVVPRADAQQESAVADRWITPFEWFSRGEPSAREWVLVIWIDENILADSPLKRFERWLEQLVEPDVCRVRAIGPVSSTTVAEMVADDATFEGAPRCREWISPWSTMPLDKLGLEVVEGSEHGALQPEDGWRSQITFSRVLPPDDVLTASLVRELDLRFVGRPPPRIALVCERDTRYGLSWQKMFEKALGEDAKERLFVSTYLSGIDGRLPTDDPKAVAEATDEPEGRARLDHLRRMARTLRDRGHFDAIGIMGTDVYDKLLVLRALHDDSHPSLFFTTDLDARFAHSSEFAWSHNLVVAAGLGLELKPELQGTHAPFRDTYQTAVYLACLQALGIEGARAAIDEPRLYEIGRAGAVDLGTADETVESGGPQPAHVPRGVAFVDLLIAVAMALVICLGLPMLFRKQLRADSVALWRRFGGRRERWRNALLLLAPLLVVLVLMWSSAGSQRGEPFALAEGISVWPTEILRLLCYVLAIYYVATSVVELERDQAEVRERFGLIRTSRRELTPWQERKNAWLWPTGTPRSVDEAWSTFVDTNTTKRRVQRAVVQALVAGVLALVVVLWFGVPYHPVRGTASAVADVIAYVACHLGSLLVLCFVVDTMIRVGSLVREVTEVGEWPPHAVERHARQTGLPPSACHASLTVRFTSAMTEGVAPLIYYPFIILLVILLSRHPIFDHWLWPPAVIILTGLGLTVATLASVVLSRQALASRSAMLASLAELRLRTAADTDDGARSRMRQLDRLEDHLAGEHGGAFTPLTSHPVLRAALIPTTGVGGLAMLEFLSAS